jgi:predicted RNase H-like HicB family nuclease
MGLTARIQIEEGSYWADIPELPGCFASGDTLDELFESLKEGVALYLAG